MSLIAVFSALSFVVTAFLAVPIASGAGYLNFQDCIIFALASLIHPLVGGIVGGNFDCRENPDLHSLDGIGKVKGEIYKDF